MFSVIKNRKLFLGFSGLLVAAAVVLVIIFGLNLGIDFRGGALLELRFQEGVGPAQVKEVLAQAGYPDTTVQPTGEREIIIKTKPIQPEEQNQIKQALSDRFGAVEELRFDSIGPTIGREVLRRAFWQIILVVLGILTYIAYAFRKIKTLSQQAKLSSWRMGMATIIALLHDILIPIGLFAVLGKVRGVEVDTLFITALLTILGFSVHDTIVVFDRVRENLQKFQYKSLATIIDYSVSSTLARSINTSSTLIFVLVALLLFGGETIFYFVLALLVGVVAGTYSSIFIASPLLYYFQKQK